MKVQSNYVQQLAMKLASDGQKLIEKAYLQADYNKNKTQNLHDSYGSAVYYKRKLVSGTKRYFTQMANEPKFDPYDDTYITGRRAIDEFLGTFRPPNDNMMLVIAVAMFYGSILESGESPLHRKYKVISMIGDDVHLLAAKIQGSRVKNISRNVVNG